MPPYYLNPWLICGWPKVCTVLCMYISGTRDILQTAASIFSCSVETRQLSCSACSACSWPPYPEGKTKSVFFGGQPSQLCTLDNWHCGLDGSLQRHCLLAAYVLNIKLLSISFLFRDLSLSLSTYFLISTDKSPRPRLAPLGIHLACSDSHPILTTIPALSILACTLPANTVERFS